MHYSLFIFMPCIWASLNSIALPWRRPSRHRGISLGVKTGARSEKKGGCLSSALIALHRSVHWNRGDVRALLIGLQDKACSRSSKRCQDWSSSEHAPRDTQRRREDFLFFIFCFISASSGATGDERRAADRPRNAL